MNRDEWLDAYYARLAKFFSSKEGLEWTRKVIEESDASEQVRRDLLASSNSED